MRDVLLPTGRASFAGMHDHVGEAGGVHRLVWRLTGDAVEVSVRRRVVDARYQETAIPSTHQRSFAVEDGRE